MHGADGWRRCRRIIAIYVLPMLSHHSVPLCTLQRLVILPIRRDKLRSKRCRKGAATLGTGGARRTTAGLVTRSCEASLRRGSIVYGICNTCLLCAGRLTKFSQVRIVSWYHVRKSLGGILLSSCVSYATRTCLLVTRSSSLRHTFHPYFTCTYYSGLATTPSALLCLASRTCPQVTWDAATLTPKFLPRLDGPILRIHVCRHDPGLLLLGQATNAVRMVNTATRGVVAQVLGVRPVPPGAEVLEGKGGWVWGKKGVGKGAGSRGEVMGVGEGEKVCWG